ncbi:MAG: hypothetical protein AAF413_00450 [Patescibacteria group bacterium]
MSKPAPRVYAMPTDIHGTFETDYTIRNTDGDPDERGLAVAQYRGTWVVRNALLMLHELTDSLPPKEMKFPTRVYGAATLVSCVEVLGSGPRVGYKNLRLPYLATPPAERPGRDMLLSAAAGRLEMAQHALVDLIHADRYSSRSVRNARNQVSRLLGESSMQLAGADVVASIASWERDVISQGANLDYEDDAVARAIQVMVKRSAMLNRKNAINLHTSARHHPSLRAIGDPLSLVNRFIDNHMPQTFRDAHSRFVAQGQDISLVKEERVA